MNMVDFINALSTKKGANITVNNILKSQAYGTEASDGKSEGKKGVSDVLVGAQSAVEADTKPFGNREVVEKLKEIDSTFEKYSDNVLKLKFLLDKYNDKSVQLNEDEAGTLEDLLKQNSNYIRYFNEKRKSDKDYNEKLTVIEQESDFFLRDSGVVEQEQLKIQKEDLKDQKSFWKDTVDAIDQQKEETKKDLKTTLIEGIGGPLGTMATQFFIPAMKVFKEQGGTDKLKEYSTRVGKMLGVGKTDNGQQGMIDAFKEAQISVQNTGKEVSDGLALMEPQDPKEVAKEIVGEQIKQTKKRIIKEKTVTDDKGRDKQGKGVFTEILGETSRGNRYLEHIAEQLKFQKSDLDTSIKALGIIQAELENTDISAEVKDLVTVVKDENKEVDVDTKEADSDRLDDAITQRKILHELQKLNEKDMGGDGSSFLSDAAAMALGSGTVAAIGSGAIGAALTAAAPVIAIAAGAIATGYLAKEGYDLLTDKNADTGWNKISKWFDEHRGLTEQEKKNADEARKALQNPEQQPGYEKHVEQLVQKAKEGFTVEQQKAIDANTGVQSNYVTEANKYTDDKKNLLDITKEVNSKSSEKDIQKILEQKKAEGKDIQINGKVIKWDAPEDVKTKEIQKAMGTNVSTTSNVDKKAMGTNVSTTSNVDKKAMGTNVSTTSNVDKKVLDETIKTLNAKTVASTSDVKKSELDDKVERTVREQTEVQAKIDNAKTQPQQKESKQNSGGSVAVIQQSPKARKKNLDEVSMIPDENFGLILVNSGIITS